MTLYFPNYLEVRVDEKRLQHTHQSNKHLHTKHLSSKKDNSVHNRQVYRDMLSFSDLMALGMNEILKILQFKRLPLVHCNVCLNKVV